MALQLQETIKGFIANYWRIGLIVYDRFAGSLTVRLDLYKDSATRQADLNAIIYSEQVVTFPVAELVAMSDVYTEIKKPQMTDAIDASNNIIWVDVNANEYPVEQGTQRADGTVYVLVDGAEVDVTKKQIDANKFSGAIDI